jgi:acetyl-CoA C-acetyltransferase
MLKEIVIVDAIRTPIGSFMGSLANIPAVDLGKQVISALLERNQLDGALVDEVIMGQVLTGGAGQNPARQAMIKAGLPVGIPAFTINKVCGSGLKAVAIAADAIASGNAQAIIAGGQENMSLALHAIYMRSGAKYGNGTLVDLMQKDGLSDAFAGYAMGVTAQNIANKYNISRSVQDEFALFSQQKASLAQKQGAFVEEILPISVMQKKVATSFAADEYIRHDTSIEALAKLSPAFDKQGSVTAGNSSGINDGAAAHLVMSLEMAEKLGKKPLARIVSYASAGVEPEFMGLGPVPAVKKALLKANWRIDELDLIEGNEAFAAQAIAVNQLLGLDVSKLNVNGGAIALGHPIGASGARVLTSLLYEMKKLKAKKGLVSLCIGGGMGIAMCVETI